MKATDALTRMILSVSRAMNEQTAATNEVAAAVASMRKESEQAARALVEQSRAMKEVLSGTHNIAKQLNMVTGANMQHKSLVARTLARLTDVRGGIQTSLQSVKDTQGDTGDLVRHVEALSGALGRRRNGSNGRA